MSEQDRDPKSPGTGGEQAQKPEAERTPEPRSESSAANEPSAPKEPSAPLKATESPESQLAPEHPGSGHPKPASGPSETRQAEPAAEAPSRPASWPKDQGQCLRKQSPNLPKKEQPHPLQPKERCQQEAGRGQHWPTDLGLRQRGVRSRTDDPLTKRARRSAAKARLKERERRKLRYELDAKDDLNWKDLPRKYGWGPTGCLIIIMLFLLAMSIDPIFVGYGLLIGMIKAVEWVINLFF